MCCFMFGGCIPDETYHSYYLYLLDPYVKVSLMCEGRRLKKRKTTTKKNTLNPVYNEAIIFDIPPENMDQVSLSIAVMDYDRLVFWPLSLTLD